ncbi:MAG: hypothetical protein M0R80_01295 [Proteobacteria bacterium]|jgi:hypothetical protein|nr:hypothetical protein [Pseudomonadota bacterium]
MNTTALSKKFEAMGARVKVATLGDDPRLRAGQRFTAGLPRNQSVRVDVRKDKEGTYFDLQVGNDVELQVLDVRPKDRHLLLLTKIDDGKGHDTKSKFLCGHDERDWFTAAIPETSGASSVPQAMEALKPAQVLQAQSTKKMKARDKKRRKTEAYIRQGEWFFMPAKNLKVDKSLILKNEPLQRGRGKPHMAEELYRIGGTTVYVNGSHPNGITAKAYAALPLDQRKGVLWRTMVRDPEVYVRGKIRHSDHKTVLLDGWYRVLPNEETKARAMRHVAFLD